MIRIGILGAAGYTGGELIRLLLGHPEAEIVFANSESNAGNLVADVHEGLYGETELRFTDAMPFNEVDVVFFCFGHGKSEAFLKEHAIPQHVKIIDLAQDFRLGPGVDQEELVVVVAADAPKPFGQLHLQLVNNGVGVEAQLAELLGHLLHVVRMAVAYAYHGVAAIEVEVFLPLVVPHLAALPAHDVHVEKGIYVE